MCVNIFISFYSNWWSKKFTTINCMYFELINETHLIQLILLKHMKKTNIQKRKKNILCPIKRRLLSFGGDASNLQKKCFMHYTPTERRKMDNQRKNRWNICIYKKKFILKSKWIKQGPWNTKYTVRAELTDICFFLTCFHLIWINWYLTRCQYMTETRDAFNC